MPPVSIPDLEPSRSMWACSQDGGVAACRARVLHRNLHVAAVGLVLGQVRGDDPVRVTGAMARARVRLHVRPS